MGSKSRLLPAISTAARQSSLSTVVDAFSGSGCVSYHFKASGYRVISNDVLDFAHHWAKASIENSGSTLSRDEVAEILAPNPRAGTFIRDTFGGLYFSDDDNQLLDSFSANLARLRDPFKVSLAIAAMTRACLKRRPRGVFTYVGDRYDDGRRDLRLPLSAQFEESVEAWNLAVFDNRRDNRAIRGSALELAVDEPALWYLDPPYFSKKSDNDYTRRYHFIEGLASYWRGFEIQEHTITKKFVSPYRDFQTKVSAYASFRSLFTARRSDDLLISYSSNSLPTREELIEMLVHVGREVTVTEIDHTYSFGTHAELKGNENNRVKEYLFFSPSPEA